MRNSEGRINCMDTKLKIGKTESDVLLEIEKPLLLFLVNPSAYHVSLESLTGKYELDTLGTDNLKIIDPLHQSKLVIFIFT